MTWLEWLLAATVAVLFMLAALFIGVLLQALRDELRDAHGREREATERLLGAWRDGAHIPPPPLPPPPPLEPLPRILQEAVEEWDDPEHRQELAAEMRRLLATGRSPAAVLLELDSRHPG